MNLIGEYEYKLVDVNTQETIESGEGKNFITDYGLKKVMIDYTQPNYIYLLSGTLSEGDNRKYYTAASLGLTQEASSGSLSVVTPKPYNSMYLAKQFAVPASDRTINQLAVGDSSGYYYSILNLTNPIVQTTTTMLYVKYTLNGLFSGNVNNTNAIANSWVNNRMTHFGRFFGAGDSLSLTSLQAGIVPYKIDMDDMEHMGKALYQTSDYIMYQIKSPYLDTDSANYRKYASLALGTSDAQGYYGSMIGYYNGRYVSTTAKDLTNDTPSYVGPYQHGVNDPSGFLNPSVIPTGVGTLTITGTPETKMPMHISVKFENSGEANDTPDENTAYAKIDIYTFSQDQFKPSIMHPMYDNGGALINYVPSMTSKNIAWSHIVGDYIYYAVNQTVKTDDNTLSYCSPLSVPYDGNYAVCKWRIGYLNAGTNLGAIPSSKTKSVVYDDGNDVYILINTDLGIVVLNTTDDSTTTYTIAGVSSYDDMVKDTGTGDVVIFHNSYGITKIDPALFVVDGTITETLVFATNAITSALSSTYTSIAVNSGFDAHNDKYAWGIGGSGNYMTNYLVSLHWSSGETGIVDTVQISGWNVSYGRNAIPHFNRTDDNGDVLVYNNYAGSTDRCVYYFTWDGSSLSENSGLRYYLNDSLYTPYSVTEYSLFSPTWETDGDKLYIGTSGGVYSVDIVNDVTEYMTYTDGSVRTFTTTAGGTDTRPVNPIQFYEYNGITWGTTVGAMFPINRYTVDSGAVVYDYNKTSFPLSVSTPTFTIFGLSFTFNNTAGYDATSQFVEGELFSVLVAPGPIKTNLDEANVSMEYYFVNAVEKSGTVTVTSSTAVLDASPSANIRRMTDLALYSNDVLIDSGNYSTDIETATVTFTDGTYDDTDITFSYIEVSRD